MKPQFRIYGTLRGLSPEAAERLRRELPFEEMDYAEGVFHIAHESSWLDTDWAARLVLEIGGAAVRGGIDFIDNEAWTIIRHVFKDGELTTKVLPLDNVLDGVRPN